MARELTPEQQVAKMLSKKTLEEIENLVKNESFKKIWKELSKGVKKEVVINAKVEGLKSVEDLVRAMDAATGASEEYFKKIEKYRSTFKTLSLAFKEGSVHMREYLEEAKKSGGNLAVLSAAGSYLTKSLQENITGFEKSALSVRAYKVELGKFALTSTFTQGEIKKMRKEMMLTKDEMGSLYDIIGELEVQGWGADQITAMYKSLKDLYGAADALKMLGSYQQILSKLPDMAGRLRAGSGGPNRGDIYNMMQAGVYKQFLQVQASGAMGGKGLTSEAAKLENHNKLVETRLEKISDFVGKNIPETLLEMSKYLELMAGGLSTIHNIVGTTAGLIEIFAALKGSGIGKGKVAGKVMSSLGKPLAAGKAVIENLATMIPLLVSNLAKAGVVGLIVAAVIAFVGGFMWKRKQKNFKEENALNLTEDEKAKIEGLKLSGGVHYAGERRRGQAEMNDFITGQTEQNRQFEALKQFRDKWDSFHATVLQMTATAYELADASGDSAKAMEEIKKSHEESTSHYKNEMDALKRQINLSDAYRSKLEKSGNFVGQAREAWEATRTETEKMIDEAEKEILAAFGTRVEAEMKVAGERGAGGKKRMSELARAVGEAGLGVTTAKYTGGEEGALTRLKQANIAYAQSEVNKAKASLESIKRNRDLATSEAERRKTEELLSQATADVAQKENDLYEAMNNTAALEHFMNRMQKSKEVMGNLSRYITDVNGSWESMSPLLSANISALQEEASKMKEEIDLRKASGMLGTDFETRMKDYQSKQIEIAQATLDYAKAQRDAKMSEIEMMTDFQREQANYLEEMGGAFSDVLGMRASALNKERESIAILENFLQQSNLSGKERASAEITLEKKKMDLNKKAIGEQKSAFEKFAGMAFGMLSDKGFRRGTMDASVMMGVNKTRVRTPSGMYIGGGTGLNRDLSTALTATEVNTTPGEMAEESAGSQMTAGEAKARQATASLPGSQKVDVSTHISVEASPELIVTIKDVVRQMAGDQSFMKAVEAAGFINKKNNNLAGSSR